MCPNSPRAASKLNCWGPSKKAYAHPGQVAQMVGASSCIPKGCGSILGQGTCLGYRFPPLLERDASLSLLSPLPPSLSLKKKEAYAQVLRTKDQAVGFTDIS